LEWRKCNQLRGKTLAHQFGIRIGCVIVLVIFPNKPSGFELNQAAQQQHQLAGRGRIPLIRPPQSGLDEITQRKFCELNFLTQDKRQQEIERTFKKIQLKG